MRKTVTHLLAALLLLLGLVATATPASASNLTISGRVFDQATQQPLQGVNVFVGVPASQCFPQICATTASDGSFFIDLGNLSASPGSQWELYFKKAGYNIAYYGKFVVSGPYNTPPIYMTLAPVPPPPGTCPAARTDAPTQTVYLPNITRTFGGPTGWYTPFIIQNTGAANTDLEVSFYKFTDGTCVERLSVAALKPGTSYANNPNDNAANANLPDSSQFSVVVRSFGASIVGVVNEHQGTGDQAEAMSYSGFTSGGTSIYLPNITRNFFGWDTPFIIQNLGTSTVTATATFRSFDGTVGPVNITRTIDPGRAKPIDPSSDDPALGAPGLVNGKQYGVVVTASQPIGAIVNAQNDAPGTPTPMALSTDGLMSGGANVYAAWAAKNANGWRTPIIVQNLGATAVAPTMTFTPLAGSTGTANTYTFPSIAPGSSKAFDPRFTFGTQGSTSPTTCSGSSTTCLGDGEYTIQITGPAGSLLAAQVNPENATAVLGYEATSAPASKYFLPNITKSLCFCGATSEAQGWTTPIYLQSVTATTATLKWYRFSDGALMFTQTVNLTAGSGVRIDPWSVTQLAAEQQYAVVVDAGTSTVTAMVLEVAPGADNAMGYTGFPAP